MGSVRRRTKVQYRDRRIQLEKGGSTMAQGRFGNKSDTASVDVSSDMLWLMSP